MSDVINDLLNSVATILKNSVEIQKEKEFTIVKRDIDYSISKIALSNDSIKDIDSKEKYFESLRKETDNIYNNIKISYFGDKDPLAGNAIRTYIEDSVDAAIKYRINRYGSNPALATESLIDSAMNDYIAKIASGSVSTSDAISSVVNMFDTYKDVMSSNTSNNAKNIAIKKIINSSVDVVDPYDEVALSDILESINKYGLTNDKISVKVGKLLQGAKLNNFQKDLTNIIESKSIKYETSFKNEKLMNAFNLINSVKDFSVDDILSLANSSDNVETADILRRRASFVDRSMKDDSLSFMESQAGIKQSYINWFNKNDVDDFVSALNKTTSKMNSIGTVSTVLSKENKNSLKYVWKNGDTQLKLDIAGSLIENSEALQLSVLSNEIASIIPDMAAFMELSSLDPANSQYYARLIDYSEQEIKDVKLDVERKLYGYGTQKGSSFFSQSGFGLSLDDNRIILSSYGNSVGDAIISYLNNNLRTDSINNKIRSWINYEEHSIIPRINNNNTWIDPQDLIRQSIDVNQNNLYKILGISEKLYITAGGNLILYDKYPVSGNDIILRNAGFGTYRIHIRSVISNLKENEMILVHEDGSDVLFKLNEIIDRL